MPLIFVSFSEGSRWRITDICRSRGQELAFSEDNQRAEVRSNTTGKK